MNSEASIMKGEAGAAPPAGLDLRFFYYVVFRHKWKIAVFFAADLPAAVARVVFQHPDAELVQPVLSQLITNYLDQHFKLHLAPGVFNDFLSKRTMALGNELKETEDKLRELKQSIGVVSVEDTKKAYAERMSKTGAELFSAMAELAEQKAMLEEPGKALLNTNSNAAATVAE